MNVPILFLIFNRPDETERVFSSIRLIKPEKLYVAADGPRINHSMDVNLCRATRAIIDKVDWKCEVYTLFRDENLGCRLAVSTAITWFFNHEDEGIILEDDCLPDPTFFNFCEIMLKRYKDDTRIVHIGGANFQDGIIRGDGDYYFSNLTHVWGWASWSRVWKTYDVNMLKWPQFFKEKHLKAFDSPIIRKQLTQAFKTAYTNRVDTWDYQLFFSNLSQNGLSIIPNVNLVSNIGFSSSATHTVNDSSKANAPVYPIYSFHEPTILRANLEADMYMLKKDKISYFKFFGLTLLDFVKSFQKLINERA